MGNRSSQSALQKKRERFLVREFLDHMKIQYRLSSIRSVREGKRPKGGTIAGPDVKITCELARRSARIGVEVGEYQVDADATYGSPGRRLDSLFWRIWKHLHSRLARNASIRECFGSVSFDRKCVPNSSDAQNIAAEIVQFLKDHLHILNDQQLHSFRRRGRRPQDKGDFDTYPLLAKHFSAMHVRRDTDLTGPFLWQYNNAAFIGVDEKTIVRLISRQTVQIRLYDWSNVKEMWLLICAGVAIPHDSAGAKEHGSTKLSSKAIRDAVKNSGFDRVIFWELRHDWHVNLL